VLRDAAIEKVLDRLSALMEWQSRSNAAPAR
jgi:hypothetical protein